MIQMRSILDVADNSGARKISGDQPDRRVRGALRAGSATR